MKSYLKSCWKWSWLATLPATLLFLHWLFVTVGGYYAFGVRYDTAPIKINALDVGKAEFFHLQRKLKLYLMPPDPQGSLRSIYAFVPEASLAKLNRSLPHSGFNYVDAGLLHGSKVRGAKVKYRGDTALHWAYHKKSMRFKTRKRSLYDGMRTFNLVAPKFEGQVHNYLGFRLASLMGLLAPRTDMVNLVMNGEQAGIYNFVEQLDEGTIRNRDRMPGDVYSGEWIMRDRYHGVSPEVFLHSGLWEKRAINNHYPEEHRVPLERLLMLLNSPPSSSTQTELSRLLNMDAWGRFSAFETLTQSYRYDKHHNWRVYYDPWRTRLEPIVWDPVSWLSQWLPKPGERLQLEIVVTRLHHTLFQNGDFLRARHRAIGEFFRQGLDKIVLSEADGIMSRITPDLDRDPNLRKPPGELVRAMAELRSDMERTLADVRDAYMGEVGTLHVAVGPGGPNTSSFKLSVDGRAHVRQLHLSYADELEGPIRGHLVYWLNGQRVRQDISGSLAIQGAKVVVSVPLLPQYVPVKVHDRRWRRYLKVKKQNQIKVEPGYYELEIEGVSNQQEVLEISVDYGNGLKPAITTAKLQKREFKNIFSLIQSVPVRVPAIWSDSVEIRGAMEVTEEVIIRPGTVVRLHPGASLIFLNRVVAEGTKQRPIRFVPFKKDQEPWGVIALKDRGADRSRFSHCRFVGGSGYKGDLFEYSAMFSVHNVSGVEVKNCVFQDSYVVDDMVHAVYADIRISDSVFRNALFDAVDLDISTAVVERCQFTGSGNDALDLMTSEVVLLNSRFENNKDKGVSIGEDSYLLAVNNRFSKNVIGIQAKDTSTAVLYNTDFVENDHAIDAYKKNWRYGGGGSVFIYKAKLAGNAKLITADKHSSIWVHDSFLDRELESEDSITLDSSVDSASQKVAMRKKMWLFPDERQTRTGLESYWSACDPRVRGVVSPKPSKG